MSPRAALLAGVCLFSLLALAPPLYGQEPSVTIASLVPSIGAGGVTEECYTVANDGETAADYSVTADCTFNYSQGQSDVLSCSSEEGETYSGDCKQTYPSTPGGFYSTSGTHWINFDIDHDACDDPFPGQPYYDPLGYIDAGSSCGANCTIFPVENPNDPFYFCSGAPTERLGTSSTTTIQTIDINPKDSQTGGGQNVTFTTNKTGVRWSTSGPGSIDANSGVYTPPAAVPVPVDVTVTVTNNEIPADQASTTLSLTTASVSITDPPGPITVNQGQTQQFMGTVTGNSNTKVTWSLQTSSTDKIDANSGLYTAPTTITAAGTTTVVATSAADSSQTAQAFVTLQPVSITIAPVFPNPFIATPGTPIALSATTSGFVNEPTLTWTPTATVAMTGPTSATYTVPQPPITTQTSVVVTATDPITKASATITLIENPGIVITAVGALYAGQTTAVTISGVGFGSGASVALSNPVPGLPTPTFQVTSATNTLINGNVTFPVYTVGETVQFVVLANGSQSQPFSANVTPVTLTPAVTPTSATLEETQSQQFGVTFGCKSQNGSACTVGQSATWSITSSPQLGTLSSSGLYTNTATGYSTTQTVSAKACATANSTACQAFQIQLTPITISVSPATALLASGQTQVLSASVAGVTGAAGTTNVTWSISPTSGTLSTGGPSTSTVYQAPNPVTASQTITVKACSTVDSSRCSTNTQLNLYPPPTVNPPSSHTVAVGGTATFTVSPSGTGPFTYTWQYSSGGAYGTVGNGGRISGATSQTLQITSVQTTDAGNYRCLVGNLSGSTNSGPGSLTVTPPSPPTVNPPSSQSVAVGGTATFTVSPSGPSPYTYVWQFSFNGGAYASLSNGGRISGATGPTLTITGVQTTDAGNYRCLVSNVGGTTNSGPGSLTVTQPSPPTVGPPANQIVAVGGTANFTVSPSGPSPYTYIWQYSNGGTYATLSNGGRISGATGPTLTITGVQTTDAGNYRCLVGNVGGTTNSGPGSLTVTQPVPPTVGPPANDTVSVGGTATFTVSPSGTSPFTYIWQFSFNGGAFATLANGGRLSGATGPTLTITGVQTTDAGKYRCLVSNTAGSTNSGPGTLTVNP